VTSRRKSVRKEKGRDVERADAAIVPQSAIEAVSQSAAVPNSPIRMVVAISAAIFVIAHLLLMIGLTTPDKIAFDEVHYVPAAKQLLEKGPHEPLLNPMHPPLAKEFMAASIRVFGDNPLGWRYPSVVFGALAIVAIYLCALALFGSQSAALATAALTFLNQMVFVQSRIAMLDIYALTFDLFGVAAFIHGYRQQRPGIMFGLAGLAFGLAGASKWSGFFPLGVAIAIVGAVRLLQGWRAQFADSNAEDWYQPGRWPEFRAHHFALCFVLVPGVAYFVACLPVTGFSITAFIEAQRRIFAENSGQHPAHLYMSSWPSWPLLMRPIWYQFDKIADDRFQAIIFLGNPMILWPALAALAICARDFIVARRTQAFLILAFYVGPWLAWATLPRTIGFIYYYLPSATVASLALVYVLTQGERAPPRWVLWAFVAASAAGFLALLPISVSSIGTSMQTYQRLMIFQSWI
jgi:dolichyl-phosphate-mannose--protein O-mannosyl transferase